MLSLHKNKMKELMAPLFTFVFVLLLFSLISEQFFTKASFRSMAFQLPELGLLTLAMMLPILTGGLNLAITYTANIAGLAAAWVILQWGEGGSSLVFLWAIFAALAIGGFSGFIIGLVIAYTKAHPILVTLSMMIFLRGVGEFLTKGGDISGFPDYIRPIGHGDILGFPIPLLIFFITAVFCYLLLSKTRFGFNIYMIGSNIKAAKYSGVNTKKTLILLYTFSGFICAIAGIVMMARFNSVRVGHGESYILITVLACFLGGVDPFGGFGKIAPVVIALITLQILASGLNLLGANQHLATAVWGLLLLIIMLARWVAQSIDQHKKIKQLQ